MKTAPPKVTIIIATYNAAPTLECCLQSIQHQNFNSWELIIIDGKSTDNTVDIIKKYRESIFYWDSETDKGIYDAWNKALTKATGEYICFLGADDYFYDDMGLQNIFSHVANEHFDLITSRGLFISNTVRRQRLIGSPWNFKEIEKKDGRLPPRHDAP